MKRRESGASEVIGAVLLVSLVVIGGAIAAAFVFGQPTPKEVPHVSFSASLNSSAEVLTLYHTGGDSLEWDQYRVIVDGVDKTPNITASQQEKPWSFEAPLEIEGIPGPVGAIVLTYRDSSGGETVLRKVGFSDQTPVTTVAPPGPWTISGYKWNVTSTGQPIGPLNGIPIRLTKTQGDFDFPVEGRVATTDGNGYYIFPDLPAHEAMYSLAEEPNRTVWKPYSPSTGNYTSIPLNHHQTSAVKNFSNERLPPPSIKISGHKYNVTWKGDRIGPLPGIVINLTLMSGDAPGFPAQGKTTTTNDTGYYEFEVPGWWDFEVPAVLPTYRLTEEVDRADWNPYNPLSGVIENVQPPATGQDFSNWKVVPNKKISGYKWGYYNTTGWLIGPVPNIQIDLTLTSGEIPDTMQAGQTNTTRTDPNGYYEFVVSGFPASYTLRETMNLSEWRPWTPSTGSYENVPPGATRDFGNMRIVPLPLGGSVMRLEKEEETGTNTSGYLVGGTYLQVDTKGGDHVTFGTTEFTFGNNEEVRFVLNGDQDRGRLTITKGPTELIEFSFNVTMQKQINGVWTNVTGASGMITDIRITNLNKNKSTTESTLTYRQPPYNSTTMLRLDGRPRITSPPDDGTPLEFDNLHIVHDNSEHEGNNIMFIWLEPGQNSLLVEGDYVFL
ncbi:MAG: type IV pilin N-terminal domain-containing protein [Methanospirillum sp.]